MVATKLVHIHRFLHSNWKMMKRIVYSDPNLEEIFKLKPDEICRNYGMKQHKAKELYRQIHLQSPDETAQQYTNLGIKTITIFDDMYPPLLKQIYDPPWVLYCKGNVALFKANLLSIVGTRSPSHTGVKATHHLISPLIKHQFVTVSGLAQGIDKIVHEFTIQNNGYTIAVLGSGFHFVYPSCNKDLAKIISREHLLVSEYPPNQKPQKWQFPLRNRIISGLSIGTVVIEAKKRSGTLITADQALQQNREVFAVPGSIFDERSEGTNRLIQQGAKLTLNAEDIIEEIR